MIRILLFNVVALSAIAAGQQATEPSFRISGTVVNALTGATLADTEVAISEQKGDVRTVTSDKDGRFMFGNLNPGKYWLGAQRRGFKLQGYEEHDNFSTAIVVGSKLSSEDLVFRLKPNAVISGTVSDEQNEPIQSAKVMLFRRSTDEGKSRIDAQGERETDDLGHYRFGDLKPGAYFVVVTAQPWYRQPDFGGGLVTGAVSDGSQTESSSQALDVVYPFTYFPGVTEESQAQAITVVAGEQFTAVINLSPVPAVKITIRGVVKGSSAMLNKEVFGQNVGSPYGESLTSREDSIVVSGIPEGRFLLTLTSSNSSGQPLNTRETPVEVTRDAEVTSTAADSSVLVSGTVALEGGSNLQGRKGVVLRNIESGKELVAAIESNGKFNFGSEAVAPGTYEMAVMSRPEEVWTKSIVVRGAKANGRQIEIPAAGRVEIALTLSRGLAQVTGTAMKEGKPFSGAMIVLVPEQFQNAMLCRRDQSDSDGTFKLARVVPGRYRLIAIEDGWDLEWLNASVLKKYLSQGTVLDASKGRYNADVQVQEK